jgi:CHAT domain-containing protein
MKVVPCGAGFKAVGFGANLGAVRDPRIGQYRVVHFATHSIFNDEHPELSGIVLSLFDERGQPQDGFLRLQEIYNLSLPVELVVLSACSTGLGKEVRGEGLVGLTRGFMYAGAAGVVASLWKVDDDATAELMRNFYAGMLREGLPPSAALRNAQLSMRRHVRWHAPYYWAGFVLHGEYRAGGESAEHCFGHGPLVAAGVAALLVSLIGFHLLRLRTILSRTNADGVAGR